MSKVAILGANGYIARNLAFVIKSKWPELELHLYGLEKESVDGFDKYVQVNMIDADAVGAIDLDCDAVFMLVGRTGSEIGFDEYDSLIDANERTLLNLLTEYRKQNSRAKIVFPSTRLVYKGQSHPLKENAEKEAKSVYAINKLACERYLELYHRVFDVKYLIFRICLPYGTLVEGASSYGTADFMLKKARRGEDITLYGDGSARRTLTYIGDLCDMMVRGALSEACVNDVFNIGGEDYSLKEMAEVIARKHGTGIEYTPWPEMASRIESGDTVFDDSKIGITLGSSTTRFCDWIAR